MSLEAALAANTAALEALTTTIQLRALPGVAPGGTVDAIDGSKVPAGTPKAAKPPKAAPKTEPTTPAVTMKQVADAGVDLANKYGREAGLSILTKYRVSKFSELKAEQLSAVYADILKSKAEFEAAAAAAASASPGDSLV